MYLLDTDVVIYHLNGQAAARTFVNRLMSSPIFISSVTFMEVEEGLPSSSDPVAARRIWYRLTDSVLLLPFDEAEALRAASIRRQLRNQGLSIRSRALDIMIAATAIEHGLTLATNNQADYQYIPSLQLVSP